MQPLELSKFRLTSSMARNLAEARWGKHGTSSDRTNRKGVFYFSCAGHGGYIVDGNALTDEEKAKIDPLVKPDYINLAVQHRDPPTVIAVRNPYASKQKVVHYFPWAGDVSWQKYPVYYFEEDCDWAVLEHLTDIRTRWTAKQDAENPEESAASREKMFNSCVEYARKRQYREALAGKVIDALKDRYPELSHDNARFAVALYMPSEFAEGYGQDEAKDFLLALEKIEGMMNGTRKEDVTRYLT